MLFTMSRIRVLDQSLITRGNLAMGMGTRGVRYKMYEMNRQMIELS
jgi:hypothetical protein